MQKPLIDMTGAFAEVIFANGIFTKGIFTEGIFAERNFRQKNFSPNGNFAKRIFRRTESSPSEISLIGFFAEHYDSTFSEVRFQIYTRYFFVK